VAQRLAGLRLERDRVAVEDAAGPVPRDAHGFVCRDTCVHQVGDGGVPGVVERETPPGAQRGTRHAGRQSSMPASRLPWRDPLGNGPTMGAGSAHQSKGGQGGPTAFAALVGLDRASHVGHARLADRPLLPFERGAVRAEGELLSAELVARFPLALVPTFLVPLAFTLHVVSLWQLLGGTWARRDMATRDRHRG
jgi:hypothetical protein